MKTRKALKIQGKLKEAVTKEPKVEPVEITQTGESNFRYRVGLGALVALAGIGAVNTVVVLASAFGPDAGKPKVPAVKASTKVTQADRDEVNAIVSAFGHAYLTIDTRYPKRHRVAVDRFLRDDLDPDAGIVIPADGHGERQTVKQIAVTSVSLVDGRFEATFSAATTNGDRDVLRYYTVPVTRAKSGGLQVSGYPVPAPAPEIDRAAPDASNSAQLVENGAAGVSKTLKRFLPIYYRGKADEWTYLTVPGATIVAPFGSYRMTGIQSITQVGAPSADRQQVLARARIKDILTGLNSLADSTITVQKTGGRWFVVNINHK